jgi:hypothetical protein
MTRTSITTESIRLKNFGENKMIQNHGASIAQNDSQLTADELEKPFGETTEPITPVEHPRQVEGVASEKKQERETEQFSGRLRAVPIVNGESIKKVEVEQEEKPDYSQHEEVVTVDDMLNFDRDHDESTLLGNRWLCKGAQSVIQGPTGVGKSSLILQGGIRWSLGRSFFGIKPVKGGFGSRRGRESRRGEAEILRAF